MLNVNMLKKQKIKKRQSFYIYFGYYAIICKCNSYHGIII